MLVSCYYHLMTNVQISVCNLFLDLNLLDWSSKNQLAVCLSDHVYLWNASTGAITELLELPDEEDYIASISFIRQGNCLAVGLNNGDVQVRY